MAVSMNAQDTVKKIFDFGNFKGLKAGFIHHVYITEGKSDKIEVTCPERYAEYLNYSISECSITGDFSEASGDISGAAKLILNGDVRRLEIEASGKVYADNKKRTIHVSEVQRQAAVEVEEFGLEDGFVF